MVKHGEAVVDMAFVNGQTHQEQVQKAEGLIWLIGVIQMDIITKLLMGNYNF